MCVCVCFVSREKTYVFLVRVCLCGICSVRVRVIFKINSMLIAQPSSRIVPIKISWFIYRTSFRVKIRFASCDPLFIGWCLFLTVCVGFCVYFWHDRNITFKSKQTWTVNYVLLNSINWKRKLIAAACFDASLCVWMNVIKSISPISVALISWYLLIESLSWCCLNGKWKSNQFVTVAVQVYKFFHSFPCVTWFSWRKKTT